MNYWKRLRWIASIVLALVTLLAFLAVMFRGDSSDETESGAIVSEQHTSPPLPAPGKGQPSRNSTGL